MSIIKACQKDDISTKVLKMNKDILAGFLAIDFKNCIDKGVFPDDLKHADVTSVHKKKDKSDKSNYRPVSILPNSDMVKHKLRVASYELLVTGWKFKRTS